MKTISDCRVAMERYKAQGRYREALAELERVKKEHCGKEGFWAGLAKDEKSLLDMQFELESLLKRQCMENARSCLYGDDGQSRKPYTQENIASFREAIRLLLEIQGVGGSSAANIMLKQADEAIFAVETFLRADKEQRTGNLRAARNLFLEIIHLDPMRANAESRVEQIDDLLRKIGELTLSIEKALSELDFIGARKHLADIMFLSTEDADTVSLNERISAGEKAASLFRSAQLKAGTKDAETLFAALDQIAEAGKVDFAIPELELLERRVKTEIAEVFYDRAISCRDIEKDQDGHCGTETDRAAADRIPGQAKCSGGPGGKAKKHRGTLRPGRFLRRGPGIGHFPFFGRRRVWLYLPRLGTKAAGLPGKTGPLPTARNRSRIAPVRPVPPISRRPSPNSERL